MELYHATGTWRSLRYLTGYSSLDRTPGYLYAFRDPVLKGDLNGDRKVTPADAAIVLRMAVGAAPTIDEADVDGDNKVTSLDALVILQAAAGSINA